MGVLQQLGLLFKKNYTLRKRKPGIVLLEVAWPLLIVGVVAIIRQGVPPKRYGNCYFQDRAMPSVGVVPFLQTFVCNLDNICHNPVSLKAAEETTYKVSALVQDLAPILGSDDMVKALGVMDKGVKVITALNDLVKDKKLMSGLDDMLKVRKFFRDPNYVKKVLIEDYKITSEDVVNAMLDSTLNVTYIFNLLSYPDFKSAVCNPAVLGSFLLFRKDVNVSKVSSALCNIKSEDIPSLVMFLQKQIDLAEIVRTLGLFERVKERLGQPYTSDQAFNDVADAIDVIFKSPSLMKALGTLSGIKDLSGFIRKIPEIINTFKTTGFNLAPVKELVNMLDPIIEQAKPNNTIWHSIKYGIAVISDITDMINGKWKGTSTEMMQTVKLWLRNLEKSVGAISPDVKLILESIVGLNFGEIWHQAVNGTLNERVTVKSLEMLQQNLEKTSIWNTTAPIVMMMNRVLQIGTIVLEKTEDLENALSSLVDNNGVLQSSLTRLFGKGPNVTIAVLKAFTNPSAIAKLFEGSFSFQSFCNEILLKISDAVENGTVTDLKNTLCSGNMSAIMDKFASKLHIEEIQQIMNETVIIIKALIDDDTPTTKANFTLLYYRSRDMIKTLVEFTNITHATWANLFLNLKLTNIELHSREWEPVLDMLNQNYVGSSFWGIIRSWGKAVSSHNLGPTAAKYIHMADLIWKYSYEQMRVTADMYSKQSPIGQLVSYATTFAPELTEAGVRMMKNRDMLYDLVTSPDPLAKMCSNNWMDKLGMPSYVSVSQIETLVCNTNWTIVIKNIMMPQSSVQKLQREINQMNKGSTAVKYDTEQDWAEIMDYSKRMVDMFQQPESLLAITNGPSNILMAANFSQVGKAFVKIGDMMKKMTYLDVARMSDMSFMVLQKLDQSLSNVTTWRAIKHSLKAWNAFMKFINSYYQEINGSSSYADLISAYPPDFQEYVRKIAGVTPDLIDALKNTILNPDALVKKFLKNGLTAPDCSSTWFSDFLFTEKNGSIQNFEKYVCQLNWTALAMDISQHQPHLQEFNRELSYLMGNLAELPNVIVNWTEIAINTEAYLKIMSGNVMVLSPKGFDFSPFNVTAIDMKWKDFVAAMETLKYLDMKKLGSLLDSIQMAIDKLNFTNLTNSTISLSLYSSLYFNHQFTVFANKILAYFNSTREINLLNYLGSEELRKVVKAIEMIPDVNKVGLNAIIRYIIDPTKATVFSNVNNLAQMCSNLTVFRQVLNVDMTNVNPAALQSAVCGINLNTTALLTELTENWNGFQDFLDAIKIVTGTKTVSVDDIKVKYSTVMEEQNHYNLLLAAVIRNPPKFVIFTSNRWMNESVYVDQWQDFLKKINDTFMKFSKPSFLLEWQKTFTKVLISNYQSIPGFNRVLQYMDVILDLVANRLKQSLVSLPEAFKDYPSLSRILSLLDQLPEVYDVFSYTSLLYPEKVSNWTKAMQTWDGFCSTNSSDLFALPPDSEFDMAGFRQKVCQMNVTQLMAEFQHYNGSERIRELFENGSLTEPVNATAVAVKIATLLDSISKISTLPTGTGFQLRIFNASVWTNTIKRIQRYLDSSAKLYRSPDTIFNMFKNLWNSVPELRQQMRWLEIVVSVADTVFDRLLELENVTRFNLTSLFKDAPEMQKLIVFLQKPGVLEVLLESVNSQKFLPLLASNNVTAGFIMVCSPLNNISDYLTVPSGVDVDLNELKKDFCKVDIMALQQEAYKEFDLQKIMNVANGSESVDWIASGKKLKRVVDMINRWIQSPPTLVVPLVWENSSYWIGILERYSMTRRGPESITSEIKNLLAKLGPVLYQNPFRQIGLVMQSILKLINENIVALENKTLTVRSMFQKIPVLRDVVSALGLQQVTLETVLTAPVRNAQLFTKVLLIRESRQLLCNGSHIWRKLLVLPDNFSTGILQEAVCNQNTSTIIANLVRNLELEDLISSLSNSSAKPDWASVFSQSEELAKNIKTLLTSLPKFNLTESLAVLEAAYNTSNLWNLISAYSAFSETFGNTAEFKGVDGYLKGTTVVLNFLNDLLAKAKVTGNTLDLASLFKDSPTFSKLFEMVLNLSPDPVTGLLSVQLKLTQAQAFATAAQSSSQLRSIFCSKSTFLEYFTVSDNFNVTAVLDVLCTLNFSAMVTELKDNFMVDVLANKLAQVSNISNPLDIQGHIQTYQNLYDKVMKLIGIRNVMFGDHSLEQLSRINTTAVMEKLMQQSQNLQKERFSSKIFHDMISQLGNTSDGRKVMAAFHIMDLYLKYFNNFLRKIKDKPLTLGLLVNNTEAGKILLPLLTDSQWLEELLQIQIVPDKLMEIVRSKNATDILCSSQLWDAFFMSANVSMDALHYLQRQACSINTTVIMWQSIAVQVQGYQFYRQAKALEGEIQRGKMSLNTSELSGDVQDFISLLTAIIKSYMNNSQLVDGFLNLDGFKSVLNKFQGSLGEKLLKMSNQWSTSVAGLIWPNLKDSEAGRQAAKIINTANIFMELVNDRLADIQDGNISLNALLGHSDKLVSLMEAYLNVSKYGLQAWIDGQFDFQKLLEVLTNQTEVKARCQDGTLASYISNSSMPSMVVDNLETVMCTYMSKLPEAFRSVADINAIKQKLMEIWKSNATVKPNFSAYVANSQKFNELLTKLTQKVKVDPRLKQTFDFSSLLNSFTHLRSNPKIIFQMLKPLGLVLSEPLKNPVVKAVLSGIDSYLVLPLAKIMEILKGHGLTIDAILNNPSKIFSILKVFGNFNTQLAVSTESYVRPIFAVLDKNANFRTKFVCNTTLMNKVLAVIKLESISSLLCKTPPSSWYNDLKQQGVGNVEIYGLASRLMTAYPLPSPCIHNCTNNGTFCTVSCHAVNPLLRSDGFTWMGLVSDVEKLTNLLIPKSQNSNATFQISPEETAKNLWDVMKSVFLNDTLQNALSYFRLLDYTGSPIMSRGLWGSFKQYVKFMGNLNAYLNQMLEKFSGHSSPVLLQDILPDSKEVAKTLQDILGQATAAELLTASVNPAKFYSLAFANKWKEIACNPREFNNTFQFQEGTNVAAIQQSLCATAQKRSSGIEKLIDLFSAGNVLKELEKLLSGNYSNVTHDVSIWDTVYQVTDRFIKNLEKLQHVQVIKTSAMSWLSPILSTLQTINNPSQGSVNNLCNSYLSFIGNTEDFKIIKPFIISTSRYLTIIKDQLSLLTSVDDIACQLASLDLTAAMATLKQAGFLDIFTQINHLVKYDNKERLDCSVISGAVLNLSSAINATQMPNAFNFHRVGHCLEEGSKHFGSVLEGITQVLKISSSILSIVQDPDLKVLFNNQKDLLPILEYIFKVLTEQKPVLLKFSDILQNKTSVVSYLRNTLEMSPEIVKSLLNSTINLDAAMFLNNPAEDIRDILCNATLLSDVLTFPDFSKVDISSLVSLLCTDSALNTAVGIKSAADVVTLAQEVLKVTKTGLSQQWFNNISNHIIDLFKDLQHIREIFEVFQDGFNLNDLDKHIPKIDRFLMSSGTDRIVKTLSAIIQDLRHVIQGKTASTVFTEIEIFIRGFMGLDVIQSRLIGAIRVSDFIKDPFAVRNYLVHQVGMSEKDAMTILEGTYSLRVFLNASKMVSGKISCEDLFSKMIILNSSEIKTRDLTDAMCHLNRSMVLTIAEKLLPELNIGDFIKQYITLSGDNLLAKANVSTEEAVDLANKLGRAEKDLAKAARFLLRENKTKSVGSDLMDELLKLPQAQTGADSMAAIQPLMCGEKPLSLANDEFKVGNIYGDYKPSVNKNEYEEKSTSEGNENNGMNGNASQTVDFCQKMYTDIKSKPLGSIIWAYFKPILRGKILFAPNTPLTRQIIQEASGIFEILKEVKHVANAWAKGTPSLKTIADQASGLKDLKNALQNDFVRNLLKGSTGLDTENLLSGLTNLDTADFNDTALDGLRVAAELVVNYTSCIELERFVGTESEEELEKKAFLLRKDNDFLGGVVFTNLFQKNRQRRSTSELPKHVIYKIRMDSDNVRLTNRLKDRIWYPTPDSNFASYMRYLRGFVQLQDMVERAIIHIQTADNSTLPGVYLQQFPYPCHEQDSYIHVLGAYLLPVLMTFAWLAALGIATSNLVNDREDGQEETLKIMGMKSALNWISWFICTLLLMMLVCLLIVIILKYGEVFRYGNGFIIFLFFLCFCVSSTMMCYLVSAFFTRTTIAVLMVLIVYFISYLPYVIVMSLEVSMKFWQKTLCCLFSTSSFGFASTYLARLEEQQKGIHWSNIRDELIPGDPMTFHWACIMMLIDSAIYLIIGWYIRNVKPGKYGLSEPWYFFVSPSYWCGCKLGGSKSGKYAVRGHASPPEKDTLFEAPSPELTVGMSVRNLSKQYGDRTVVDGLNADFFEGQITALLGHNGAAKTTTMNMLIGMLDPTSGDVSIYDKKATAGMSGLVGVCPQHNALLQYMTVEEHMDFYSGVKCDWSSSRRRKEIKSLLQDVELWSMRHVQVKNLSGGMQRRLCVALAFVGGSKAVVLDEPTSGVDPHARRNIWNLITRQRLGRTILLSTHHLDEADTVGDRIAILHMGHILCCGSPMFLKEKLGGGYHLTVDMGMSQKSGAGHNGNGSSCNSNEVLSFINHYLPNARLVEEVGTEITFSLPKEDCTTTPFHYFFSELDRNQTRLNISSYGVSDTTMEDVFLKVTNLADSGVEINDRILEAERLKTSRTSSGTESTDSKETSSQGSEESILKVTDSGYKDHNSGASLKWQQCWALLIKRFHHFRRDWRMIVSTVVLPVLMFLAAMGFAKIRPTEDNMPSLIMDPALYGPKDYMFYKDDSPSAISDALVRTLTSPPGIGTTCMENFDPGYQFSCSQPGTNFSRPPYILNPNATCRCYNWQQQCDKGAEGIPPPQIMTSFGNYLQKLDGYDITHYLWTSFYKFIDRRWGGWSYSVPKDKTSPDPEIKVWFNNKGYHALPSFFNAFSNSLLRAKIGESQSPEKYGITVYNHPIAFNKRQLSTENLGEEAADAGISLVILLAFTFIPCGLILYLVNERLFKEKQLQFISGTGPLLYWTSALIWDLLVFSITVGLAAAVMAIFQLGPYYDRQNLSAIVVLLLLYGWAVLPMMYSTLKLFSSAISAYMVLFCINMLLGLLTVITILVFIVFNDMFDLNEVYNVCRYLFLIFPQFCLGQGLVDLSTNHFQYKLLARFGDDVYKDPFSFQLLGWNYIALAIEGLVFFILTVLIETKKSSSRRVPNHLLEDYKEDDDVHRERMQIQHGGTKDDILVVNGLSKIYRRGLHRFLAVDRISFGVEKGECFGLLGVNGAGKTTTFRMMTGDTSTNSGKAFLNGHRISCGNTLLGQEVGYCPQDGGLDLFLTGEELLYCHGRLKGMTSHQIKTAVSDLISKLHLTLHAKKPVNTYSGGTKRKLSLAIAMLGEPPILFLDEPTTGMDPGTRRLAWKCITQAVHNGQSIVLTSHSMNECDALCSKLAIMVNGRLQCIGSSQHLKNKFGDGYTVVMHLSGLSNNRFNVEHEFLSRFPGSAVKDQHQSVVEVSVPRNASSVAELFGILQHAQENNHITRYSLSQTTLDTVFINFAREQNDGISNNEDYVSTDSESSTDQSSNLVGPFTNQTYAYMNPQFLSDPEDAKIQQQYDANLIQLSGKNTKTEDEGYFITKL